MDKRNYYVSARFDGKGGRPFGYFKKCFEWTEVPLQARLQEILLQEARHVFEKMGQAYEEPINLKLEAPPMEMPIPPSPPRNDPRPLQRWKVSGYMVCHDIKYSTNLSGILYWPEKPPQKIVNEMAYHLAAYEIMDRGDHPSYADYSDYEVSAQPD